jgi:glycosyltransferase involved in cell wall biosynthesis
MVNGRIFAEHIYQDQLPFIGLPGLILENKAPVAWNVQRQLPQPERKILFSGFISRESGILTALALWKKSTLSQKSWTLEIIGYCPSEELRNQIKDETRNLPEVTIQDLSIWHSDLEIEACLKTSFAILATYRESIANAGKVPTKFWEAGFLGRWIVCSHRSAFLPLLNEGFPIAHFQEDARDPLGFLEEWYNRNKLPAPNSRMGFASYI